MSDNLYFLFGGDNYTPDGGMNDLVGTFSSVEEAYEAATENVWRPWLAPNTSGTLKWWQIATVYDGQLKILSQSNLST
jgi:hypothetical protein